MSSIGPQIPPHLLKQLNTTDDDIDNDNDGPQPAFSPTIGPQIPAQLQSKHSTVEVFDDDDDDSGPKPQGPSIATNIPRSDRIPPTVSRPVAGPSFPSSSSSPPNTSINQGPRTIGPSLPNYASAYDHGAKYSNEDEDEDSDDDIGPKPLPAGVRQQQPDAVQEFLEREEKRRKLAEEAAKPKAPKRDEWMLVPPTSQGLLGNLDTTKLKARQFSRGVASSTSSNNDNSLWTETPAERQQRLADEVSGKKRRVTDTSVDDAEELKAAKRRRKKEEEAIRRGVDEHTRKQRGAALVDQHATASKKTSDEPPAIWDHSRDMGLGGRLMDDDKRKKMLQEAKGLGDRFGSGKSGGFL